MTGLTGLTRKAVRPELEPTMPSRKSSSPNIIKSEIGKAMSLLDNGDDYLSTQRDQMQSDRQLINERDAQRRKKELLGKTQHF